MKQTKNMEMNIKGIKYQYVENIFGNKIIEFVNLGGATKPTCSGEYNFDEPIISKSQFQREVRKIHAQFA